MFKLTRETDYEIGEILEIIECTFHPYKLGTKVKILNKDFNSYHVVNVTTDVTLTYFYWVKESQVKQIREKDSH